jgi:hypothetical protein
MKFGMTTLCLAVLILGASNAHARSDVLQFPIKDAMETADYKAKIGDFKFVWGDSVRGTSLGSISTRKATNAVFKPDQTACNWALLSALIAFKQRALSVSGSSVQGIKSNVTDTPFSSTTQFQCVVGFTNARVSLTGTIVK